MTIDFSDYEKLNEEQQQRHDELISALSRSTPPEPKEKPDMFGLIFLGCVGFAIIGSTASAVPSMLQQSRIESARAERLQADGLRQLSASEASRQLRDALPMIDPNSKELAIVTWEQIISNNNIPPGAYFGKNLLVVKALNGRGDGTYNDRLVSSHAIGQISPEQAYERLHEVQKSMQR
jgi:hypothetical protein